MKVAVIANYEKEKVKVYAERLISLLREHDFAYILKEYRRAEEYIVSSDEIRGADIFIVIGGDGTIIHTSKAAAKLNKPIIGVNAGNLGFTAALEGEDIERITEILKGDYELEKRMMLDAEVTSLGGEKIKFTALNDAVVKSAYSAMLNYSIAINERRRYEYSADGLIVATPTGSTAYSLSAGGPVVEPTVDCMIYTPICPHSLFNRSIIYAPDTKIHIALSKNKQPAFLTIDGGEPYEIKEGDSIVFSKSKLFASFVNAESKSFYDTLNKKIINDGNGG